ncbi:MAG: YfhO family protein [Planctomycetes bacterium]|nr:YfhO family protein [Planctomycetota bacterium]
MREVPPPDAPPAPSWRELLLTGLLCAAVTLAGALLFYGAGIATGRELFFTHDIGGSDIWHLNYPMKRFYQQELAAGRLPLWSPEIGTGFPLHAEGQVAALYPPNLALFGLLPLAIAFNWGILLHVVLSGAFAAGLARQLGAGRGASAVAAIAFAFSGFFVTHLKHINMTASAVWLPLLLLLLERFAARRSAAALGLLAAAVGAMILAGHPQIVYNNLLVAGAWALVALVRAAMRRPIERGGPRNAALAGGALAYGVVIGVLLGAAQLLPTAELNSVGPREGGMSVAEATEWEYHPKFLLGFLLPGHWGDPGELREEPVLDPRTGQPVRTPDGQAVFRLRGFDPGGVRMLHWEMTGYVGLLPLGLAAAALALGWRRRRAVVVLLGAFLAVSLLLVLGEHGGLFHVAWNLVPGFKLFRFHDRFLLQAALFLAVLAALGLTWLVARVPGGRRRSAAVAAAVIAGAICFVDLFVALGEHNPRIARERWENPPPSVERIREEEGPDAAPFRVADVDPMRMVFTNAYYRARGWTGDLAPYDVSRNMLDPNLNLLHGIAHLQIYYQIYPRWMREATPLFYHPADPQRGLASGLQRIADLFNVRYILAPRGSALDAIPELRVLGPELERYPVIARYPGDTVVQGVRLPTGEGAFVEAPPFEIRLHRNPRALPRALLVPRARQMLDRRSLPGRATPNQLALLDPGFDPEREVLLHRGADDPLVRRGEPAEPIVGGVRIRAYEPQLVQLEVEAPRDCWLFLSDTYYPGWVATVDGEETWIHRANITGRAVEIPAGRHEVIFTYRPTSVRNGVLLGALGLFLLASLWLQARLASRLGSRRRRR